MHTHSIGNAFRILAASTILAAFGSVTLPSTAFAVELSPVPVGAPLAPSQLSATPGTAQVSLSWAKTHDATSYIIYRGTARGAEDSTPIATGVTRTNYTNTGLTNGVTYFYYVTAVNSAGTSPWSKEVKARPEQGASRYVQVNLTSAFNEVGIYNDGVSFAPDGGIGGSEDAFSGNLLGRYQVWNGIPFAIGPPGDPDIIQGFGQLVPLPANQCSNIRFLMTAIGGNQPGQALSVNYTDGSHESFTQSMSDWYTPQGYPGESNAIPTNHRNVRYGNAEYYTFTIYAYNYVLNNTKTVESLTMPNNPDVFVFATTLMASASVTPIASIDAGGAAVGTWFDDANYSGGIAQTWSGTVDTSQLTGTIPPQAVLQSARAGTFTYAISGFVPNSSHTVTLYFVEPSAVSSGTNVFTVSANSVPRLNNFDIISAAGASMTAVKRSFSCEADSLGAITLSFTPTAGEAKISGIVVN